MKSSKQFTWLTSRNTNKLHAIPSEDDQYKIGCRSICGISAYGSYHDQNTSASFRSRFPPLLHGSKVVFWYVGSEGLDKCKNCLRKIGETNEEINGETNG